jgi:hypothetical protein
MAGVKPGFRHRERAPLRVAFRGEIRPYFPGKKTAETIQQEVAREVEDLLARIFRERRQQGQLDLEAVEFALRSALHQAGSAALQQLLRSDPPPASERNRACRCGHRAQYRGLRTKTLLTALGEVELQRPYFLCAHCHQGQFPVDPTLDVENSSFSPGVRRMLALVGQGSPFDHGREQMELLAGLKVTTKAVERITEAMGADIAGREQRALHAPQQLELAVETDPPMPVLYVEFDGTGVPVVRRETAERAGKIPGQPAHTREAKLGCVFTQTKVDEQGRPVRDEASTTYTGAIETAEQFARRIYAEAVQRGWYRARKRVVLGDGAEWIWNLVALCFPGAIEIVDLYHAREHLWELARKLYPGDEVRQKRWLLPQLDKLENGRMEKLVAKLRAMTATHPELKDKFHTESEYFARNAARMRYPEFRRQGLFVGSGVIEAACKTVIGSRLKQSGMFWTVNGANAMIALRCTRLSGRFEDYWEERRAA